MSGSHDALYNEQAASSKKHCGINNHLSNGDANINNSNSKSPIISCDNKNSVELSQKCNSEPRRKVALITGISGQDGSYLAELLLEKGYEVHGIVRKLSAHRLQRIQHLSTKVIHVEELTGKPSDHFPTPADRKTILIHYADLIDKDKLVDILLFIQPDEIYNLAGKTDVIESFELTEYTANVNGLGVMRLMDAVKESSLVEKTRFFQCSPSEMFGNAPVSLLDDSTKFFPQSPYAVSKAFAHWMVKVYREEFSMYAVSGIMFSHTSPRRGFPEVLPLTLSFLESGTTVQNYKTFRERYVTSKICRAVARIALGQQECLELGNINITRDWGHAKDFVKAIWLILQQDEPDDYTVCTGEAHSVREVVEVAFQHIGVNIVWEGEGVNEVGKDSKTSTVRVKINPELLRPIESPTIMGDNSKAVKKLGWKPEISFKDIISELVQHDLDQLRQNLNK